MTKTWTRDTWDEAIEYGNSEAAYETAVYENLLTEDQENFLTSIGLTLDDVFNGRYDANDSDNEPILDMFYDWNQKLGWQEFGLYEGWDESFSNDEEDPLEEDEKFTALINDMETEEEMVESLAEVAEAALDEAYGYGIVGKGNNFGWLANLESARVVYDLIRSGEVDIETLAAASHDGWSTVAIQDFRKTLKLDTPTNPDKVLNRMALAVRSYDDLSEDQKEKDRTAVRAILDFLQDVSV